MNITPEEYNSVKFYQDSGFYFINTYLRKNEFNSTRYTIENIQDHIKNLDIYLQNQIKQIKYLHYTEAKEMFMRT